MKKSIFCAVFLTLLWAVCTGCAVPEQEGRGADNFSLTLMTWNVHNLFDGNDDGYEYSEFTKGGGWSQEKYLNRIYSISAAISGLEKQPDIILLQEIESRAVLEDIAGALQAGYLWSYFAGNYGAVTGVGIISRIPLGENENSIRAHSITIGKDTTPRPVLEVRIDNDDDPFVIFVCHWKSKVGGDNATEPLRRAGARVILRRMRELWKEEPDLGVIVAGDLNLNHDDFERRGSDVITALIPDDSNGVQLLAKGRLLARGNLTANEAEIQQNDFFILSGNKPPEPAHFNDQHIVLFSPWMDGLEYGYDCLLPDKSSSQTGSYYYKDAWETIDHFLLSSQFFNGSGFEYEETQVINKEPFANANGIPAGYNERTGNGLSDHLPLLLTLKNKRE